MAGAFHGRPSSKVPISFFLASHLFRIEARAELNMPSGTTGMPKMSYFSFSVKLVRLSHLTLSCSTNIAMYFPTSWTAQCWTHRQISQTMVTSSHTEVSYVKHFAYCSHRQGCHLVSPLSHGTLGSMGGRQAMVCPSVPSKSKKMHLE